MNVRSTDTKPDVVAEASAWFIEFRAEAVTAGTRARFDEWLRRSPEHIQAYLEVAAGWSELPTADPQGRIDIPALIKRARASPDENVVSLPTLAVGRPQGRRMTIGAWATASFAGLVLVMGLASWVVLSGVDVYSTGVGEQRTVRLVDGSTIELNAMSAIRVRLSKRVREVELSEGQGLFHVAKDRTRPFIVRSEGATVRAVGTQFDVNRKHDVTVVTVLEGRVAVAESKPAVSVPDRRVAAAAPVFLTAGEQVAVPRQSAVQQTLTPKRADLAVTTAWVHKRLIFDETALAEVVDEFNRYNARRLVIADPELRSVEISGVYSSTDPDSLLGFLRAQPNIQLSETDAEIRITLGGKK